MTTNRGCSHKLLRINAGTVTSQIYDVQKNVYVFYTELKIWPSTVSLRGTLTQHLKYFGLSTCSSGGGGSSSSISNCCSCCYFKCIWSFCPRNIFFSELHCIWKVVISLNATAVSPFSYDCTEFFLIVLTSGRLREAFRLSCPSEI